MKKYSMTFIFNNEMTKVLLIKKNKPDNMKGLLNGIGGHKEDYDKSYEDCAIREIKEESDLLISTENLINIGELSKENEFYVALFAVKTKEEDILKFNSLTDEKVFLIDLNKLNKNILYIDAYNIIKKCLLLLK